MLLAFNDKKGIKYSKYMLNGTKGLDLNGETVIACFGLAKIPKCPDEGCWWIDNGKDAVRLWNECCENKIIIG